MHRFFSSLFLLFLSPLGLVVLAALDSSMVFYLPAAVEAAVVILTARHRELVWLFPFLAAAGSAMGAFATFLVGEKIGEKGLMHWVPEHGLERIQKKIKDKGAVPLATTALLPPPFPLAPFLLACGALKVKRRSFLLAFGVARLFRYSIVAIFAWFYGNWILRVIKSGMFQAVVVVFVVIAVAGTIYSAYHLMRNAKRHRSRQSGPRQRQA
jgi:membrane protein YqaA with SNARE-associated domain